MAGIFDPQKNCWKIEKTERAAVVIDAENYFRYVRSAMAKAKNRIVLLGWDFNARIKMHDTQNEADEPLEVGDNVCRIRKEKGLTQERLSELSGLSQQYISDLERGKRNPTIVTIYELAMAMKVGHLELVSP